MDEVTKAKIVVVFTDIRGSSRWTRRMGDDEEMRHSFMMAYDRESQFFRERTNATSYKRIGDGRMFTYHLQRGRESEIAANVLVESLGLIKRVGRLIARLPSPRPNGFRIRLMSGTVLNEVYEDGERDWLGYVPNTCHKLLAVAPEIECVAHETVKELIRPNAAKKVGLAFTLLATPRRCPDGVDREDMEALWSVAKRR